MELQQISKQPSTLESLPVETLLQIAESCHSFAGLSRLASTNKWFYRVLNHWLYKLDVRSGSPCALFWACQTGSLDTLKLAHQAGAALNQVWASKEPIQRLPPNPYNHSPEFYQKVALRLTDPADDQEDEEANNGWPETPYMVPEDFPDDWDQTEDWNQMQLDNDQQPEELVEQEVQSDEESDTEWVIDEGPWEEPDQPRQLGESHTPEEDHSWPADTDESGQPLLKTASRDSKYTWRNDFLERLCRYMNQGLDPDFDGKKPVTQDLRRFPVFWWHPIDLAVYFGHKKIIQYLVENGVSIQHANSRGLCRQRDISFASPYRGCRHGTYPFLIPGDVNWRYLVHHAFGLIACKEDWEMGNLLLDITGMRRTAKHLGGFEDGLVVDLEDPQDQEIFFIRKIHELIRFSDGTTASVLDYRSSANCARL
ncbi:hypothetical protein QBC45DRAFT_472079 [Copromyces sp. CBS 386.78]|nr:hypothetical protein QBC45DRAFT_472079 [Copromyces sp. CBS 386.78]